MYGVKVTKNDKVDIYRINDTINTVRITTALVIDSIMKELRKMEDWTILEETDTKYHAKGVFTGFDFVVEIVEMGA